VRLFDAYNSELGRKISMFKGTGRQHDDLTEILGAVLDYPDVDEAKWMRTMHGVLASTNPYWGRSPSVGVVFGRKVVQRNLDDPGNNNRRPDPAARPEREETTSPEYQRQMAAESVTERVHREQTGETVPSEEIKPLLIAMERRKRELGRELTSEECEQVGREVHERFSRARA
jgi:hypothetical protein